MMPIFQEFTTAHGKLHLDLLQIESMVQSYDAPFNWETMSVSTRNKIPVVTIRTKSGVEWRVHVDHEMIHHIRKKITEHESGK